MFKGLLIYLYKCYFKGLLDDVQAHDADYCPNIKLLTHKSAKKRITNVWSQYIKFSTMDIILEGSDFIKNILGGSCTSYCRGLRTTENHVLKYDNYTNKAINKQYNKLHTTAGVTSATSCKTTFRQQQRFIITVFFLLVSSHIILGNSIFNIH